MRDGALQCLAVVPGKSYLETGASGGIARPRPTSGDYQLQHELQQQFPPPQVVLAPGATWTNAPPVAVLPTWLEKLNMFPSPPIEGTKEKDPAG
ncbi:hypothetical protein [Kitasatospora cinereorecta]|uniref:Uncharacterized protein n=1 Tax=Kitasatospora cinereorecta TaxID=285560 RepID=A0ABW0V8R3_9ACTN